MNQSDCANSPPENRFREQLHYNKAMRHRQIRQQEKPSAASETLRADAKFESLSLALGEMIPKLGIALPNGNTFLEVDDLA